MTLVRNTARTALPTDQFTTNELTVVGGHLRVGSDARSITGAFDVREAGLVGDGITDNSPKLTALLATLPEYSNIFFPAGQWRFNSTVVWGTPMRVRGVGMATRLQPGDGLTGVMWDLKDTSSAWTAWDFSDLAFDGRARAVPYTALRMEQISEAYFARLLFTSIDGCGLDVSTMCRDSRFEDLIFRMCGNATAPEMWVHEPNPVVSDPCNSLDFVGCKFHYAGGRMVVVENPRSDDPLRGIWFHHCKFHSGYTEEGRAAEYGYMNPPTSDYGVGGVLVRNARGVFFTDCRWHLTAPGIPLLTLADHPSATPAANYTGVNVTHGYFGQAGYDLTATFTAAASNRLTLTAHRLPPTAMVRATASTVSGVTVGVDYFVIHVDVNTISLASSFNNAMTGTAMTTGTTGSATLVAQNAFVTLHGDKTGLVEGICGYASAVNRAHIVGLTTTRLVKSNNPSESLTDPLHYQGP